MYFTEEERKIVEKHLPLIELIVKTASSSYISIEAREDLMDLAVNHLLASCKTCPSGLFMAIVRIYGRYVEDNNELRKIEELKEEKKDKEVKEVKEVKAKKNKKTGK